MYKSKGITILIILCFLLNFPVFPQGITSHQIDSIAGKALETFDVPGMAVAVIKDGKVIHSRGYGVRSLRTGLPVDENTLFGIASNTKAFTTAALGILVDEEKVKWNDRVIDYIPEFRMFDPYVTREFTIRDLLTHRSGLGLGAGDLMIFPDESFSVNEIIHNLRYLKPVSSFRTKYDYDNLMYIVAGEIIARVAGVSYGEFIETRIMKPLGMVRSAASFGRLKDTSNVIDAHVPVNGKVTVAERDPLEISASAGGIYTNLTDMSKWIIMQINGGKYGAELKKQLFSERVQKEMWSPNTMIPVRDSSDYNTHFAAYGLGWRLSDVEGYKQVQHTGGLLGIVTMVTIIPELKLGIMVFTNQQSGAAFMSVTGSILDSFLGIHGIDRIEEYSRAEQRNFDNAKNITDEIWKDIEAAKEADRSYVDNSVYTGTYSDNWFGSVSVTDRKGKLWFESKRSPSLSGEMFPYKANTFVVRWSDRTLDADAYAMFYLDKDGKAFEFKMLPISPMTDFSFDFQDLDFVR